MNSDKPIQTTKKNIVIMGGTFDPIHNGHIETARETAKWLNVDKLFLLPAHIPPHKSSTTANALQRETMVRIICQQHPLFQLDDRELKRKTSSYTVTSLQEIKQEQPNSKIFFVIGMDSLMNFTTWHDWQKILTLCHIVVNIRPGYELNQINTVTRQLLQEHKINDLDEIKKQEAGRIIFHQNQSLNIASSEIRKQLLNNKINNNHLPKSIHNYIIQENLYRE
jgi:nicotinate-nucleotide adenylyltransferase